MDEGAPLEWELRAQEQARRGLAWERSRKRVVILLAAITVLGFAGGAVWALQSDSIGDREAPRAFRQSEVPATIATKVKLDCRSPLTSDDPLRIWIAGDSLVVLAETSRPNSDSGAARLNSALARASVK